MIRIGENEMKKPMVETFYTNATFEVEKMVGGEGWGVATNGVVVVPAPDKQGFFGS